MKPDYFKKYFTNIPPKVKIPLDIEKSQTYYDYMNDRTRERHFELLRKTLVRLLLIYWVPFVLLTVYFNIQSSKLLNESRSIHLQSIAEHQANTLDLFLRERVVNLANLIDNPRIEIPLSTPTLQTFLTELKKSSETFVDIGAFDSSGIQIAYAGPFSSLEKQDYSSETWFTDLRDKTEKFIITDMYLGFRKQPHFTIAVKRRITDQYIVLRSTLEPKKIYEYVVSLEGTDDVLTSIVSKEGYYQVVTQHVGTLLEESSVVPPFEPRFGTEQVKLNGATYRYGYSWLHTADWALIVQWANQKHSRLFYPVPNWKVILVSFGMILLAFIVVVIRSLRLVKFQEDSIQTKNQLVHAAKLASLGELAAGIAHEINNPVAIMVEEAGWIEDILTEEEFKDTDNVKEMKRSTKQIKTQGNRCKQITHKLLSFARKTDPLEKKVLINDIIREVTELLEQHTKFENIKIKLELCEEMLLVNVSPTELEQVLINLINNGIDTIESKGGGGSITITTHKEEEKILLDVSDTGQGIPVVQQDRIFDPFFTTKPVGKGTGIGLSTVFGIVTKIGGKISFDSTVGVGTTFHIELPAVRSE